MNGSLYTVAVAFGLRANPISLESSEDPLARRSLEFSSVVTREGRWYVADCPELEIASQGKTVELALKNLPEAIELYLRDEDAKA